MRQEGGNGPAPLHSPAGNRAGQGRKGELTVRLPRMSQELPGFKRGVLTSKPDSPLPNPPVIHLLGPPEPRVGASGRIRSLGKPRAGWWPEWRCGGPGREIGRRSWPKTGRNGSPCLGAFRAGGGGDALGRAARGSTASSLFWRTGPCGCSSPPGAGGAARQLGQSPGIGWPDHRSFWNQATPLSCSPAPPPSAITGTAPRWTFPRDRLRPAGAGDRRGGAGGGGGGYAVAGPLSGKSNIGSTVKGSVTAARSG